jgi:hypothetical protein
MAKISLGAYQTFDLIPKDLGDQFTNSGTEPNTCVVVLTTAMDENFVNKSVTALLSEEAQRRIIKILADNLHGLYNGR